MEQALRLLAAGGPWSQRAARERFSWWRKMIIWLSDRFVEGVRRTGWMVAGSGSDTYRESLEPKLEIKSYQHDVGIRWWGR